MNRSPFSDDAAFDRAWAAFARHDRAAAVPTTLEARVQRSVLARMDAGAAPSRRRTGRMPTAVQIAAGVAASLVAVAAGVWARAVPVPSPPATLLAPSPAMALPDAAAAVPLVAGLELTAPPRAVRVRRTAASRPDVPPAPVSAPSAGVAANGPLQVIRVRIAASALDALGVAVTGPPGAGLVDVDLVVGADGWPVDVRRIRPVIVDGPSQ